MAVALQPTSPAIRRAEMASMPSAKQSLRAASRIASFRFSLARCRRTGSYLTRLVDTVNPNTRRSLTVAHRLTGKG